MTDPSQLAEPDWPRDDTTTSNGEVRLYGRRFQQNPEVVYAEIRRLHGSVAPVLLEADVPAWLVLGYRDLHQVLSNEQVYARSPRRWNQWHRVPKDWALLTSVASPTLLITEGKEHRRRAGVVNDIFAGLDPFELRKYCERIADWAIDRFAGVGAVDLMAEYAQRVPILMLARMFDFPESEGPELVTDIGLLSGGAEAQAAYQRINDRVGRLLARKRQLSGPDLASRMLEHSAELTDEELYADLTLVLAIGQQHTSDWIGNTLRLMLTDPDFAATFAGGRSSVGHALNQVLWEDTPVQNYLGRWAAQNTQLGGQRIREGDLLVIGMAAANADPQVRSSSFSGSVGNHAHLSFSHGEHGCPHAASEVAELMARTAIEVLFDRLPDLTLAIPPDQLTWTQSVWTRTLTALPAHFTPAVHG